MTGKRWDIGLFAAAALALLADAIAWLTSDASLLAMVPQRYAAGIVALGAFVRWRFAHRDPPAVEAKVEAADGDPVPDHVDPETTDVYSAAEVSDIYPGVSPEPDEEPEP